MNTINALHPGIVLMEEFLTPLNITAYRLSKAIHIPQTRISQILKGNRRITADTALRLGSFFDNPASFWLELQNNYDIQVGKHSLKETLKIIRKNAPSFNHSKLK